MIFLKSVIHENCYFVKILKLSEFPLNLFTYRQKPAYFLFPNGKLETPQPILLLQVLTLAKTHKGKTEG